MTLADGTRIASYEILGPLGAGGMGEVYRARDTKLNRVVALKVLPELFADDPDRRARFEREAQAVAALSHPNILAIHDYGIDGRRAYAAMELLEGETLRARLHSGPLPPRKAVDYAVQVARGLAAAHDKGVIHRDLKPENIVVTHDGLVKILDFGLARQAHAVMGSATAATFNRTPCRAPFSGQSATCHPNKCAANRSMRGATCLHSALSSTKCSRAAARFNATRPRRR